MHYFIICHNHSYSLKPKKFLLLLTQKQDLILIISCFDSSCFWSILVWLWAGLWSKFCHLIVCVFDYFHLLTLYVLSLVVSGIKLWRILKHLPIFTKMERLSLSCYHIQCPDMIIAIELNYNCSELEDSLFLDTLT